MRRKRLFALEPLEDRICLDGTVPPQFAGAPIALPTGGAWTQSPFMGSPIFADLQGNGKQELIVEAAGGKMIAYGTNAQGQLVKFQEYDTSPLPNGQQANFKSTPVVVNVPGIGAVIVAALGHDEAHLGTIEDGRVYAFNAVTGKVLPGWPQITNMPPPDKDPVSGVTGALTVGYLEGNGMPDIIVDSFSTMVTAYRMNGSVLWQFENDETVEPGAVVADLNGDGKQEVIFDSGMSGTGSSPFLPPGGDITILNGADGKALTRRIHTGEVFFALAGRGRPLRRRSPGDHCGDGPLLQHASRLYSRPASRSACGGRSRLRLFPEWDPRSGLALPYDEQRHARPPEPGRSPSRPTFAATVQNRDPRYRPLRASSM